MLKTGTIITTTITTIRLVHVLYNPVVYDSVILKYFYGDLPRTTDATNTVKLWWLAGGRHRAVSNQLGKGFARAILGSYEVGIKVSPSGVQPLF